MLGLQFVASTRDNTVSYPRNEKRNSLYKFSILVYVNLGNSDSDTATLAFTFSGSSTTRQFDIKVTQVKCGSQLK